jgi:membrane carboxypeptidase/penicillin-binding protein PbpC
MKKFFLAICFISAALMTVSGQDKKAEREAAALAAFVRQATAELETLLGQTAMESGGWKVTTTLDYDLQIQAACASQTWMNRLEAGDKPVSDSLLPDESMPAQATPCEAARLLPTLRPGSTGPRLGSDLRTSAILLDPKTGQILALAGEISTTGETRTLHGHPPGSVLTPFIYLTGFSRGFGPASLVWDIPQPDEDEPAIGNPDGQFHGPIRQRTAMANDYWVPAAGLLAELGSAEVWRLASRFGLPEAYASLEAGRGEIPFPFAGGEIDLVQAAQAYGVLANQGILTGRAAPASSGTSLAATTLLRVESTGGNVILDASQPQSQAIVGQPLAYLINSVLGDSLARRASLGYPNPLDIGRPAAARLGRTANGMDTWAVGYTPNRVAGVWLGRGPDSPELESQANPALDPSLAAGLWHALIQYAVRDLPADGWVPPEGIISMEVCDPSGLLPTQTCPAVVDEVFVSGNQPVSVDSLYQIFQVNRETKQLATVFTPPEWIESQVYLVYPPAAQEWARQAGLPFAPDTYDAIQPAVAFPDAFLSDPEMFAVVSGVVEIQGTASGDDFSYYRLQVGAGINPQEWVQIQPDYDQPVTSGKLAQWDTRGLSGLYALRLMVIHGGQQVQTATLQVTVDNSPPRAWIQYPSPEQAVDLSPSGTITLLAQAEDQIGLQQVDWMIDGLLISRQEQGPYHHTWNATPGAHTVQLQVTDLAGNRAESNPVTFTVVE